MSLTRWKLKSKNVIFEIWFKDKHAIENGKFKDYLMFCYGCPSHPFDHNSAITQSLIDEGYILIYPSYIGTWESDGICTIENAVDTLKEVITNLKKESGIELRSNDQVFWKYKPPILIGGSFGGSVVLVTGAKLKEISTIVALAPVINFKNHAQGIYEEQDLNKTWNIIQKGWKYLWRIKKENWNKLIQGKLDLNPDEYLEELQDKNLFLIHGKNDKVVHYSRSKEFFKLLKLNNKNKLLLIENKGHLANYECGLEPIKSELIGWLKELGTR